MFPTGQLASCNADGSTLGPSGVAQCGTAGSAVFAADESSNDFNKHLKHSDVPANSGSHGDCAGFACGFDQTKCQFCYFFFYPSFALLYLSTGRLPPLILAHLEPILAHFFDPLSWSSLLDFLRFSFARHESDLNSNGSDPCFLSL